MTQKRGLDGLRARPAPKPPRNKKLPSRAALGPRAENRFLNMRDFSKVSPSLWHSERFNGLASDDARLAYLYMLTCQHQTSAGCYRLPDAYAAADLRWPVERYQKARAELVKAGLVRFDTSASVLMITRWFRFNPPMNEKHHKGIKHILERLTSQAIWADATAELDECLSAIAKAKAEQASKQAAGEKVTGNPWAGWKPRAA